MSSELHTRILDLEKMVLYTDSPEPGKRARLQFGGRGGLPRITVFTGVTDAKSGIIQGPLELSGFVTFLELLEKVCHSSEECKYKIDIKTNVYEQNKRTDAIRVMAELWFGRDEKGMVWIALTGEGFPKIRFDFMNGQYTEIYKNGVKMENREISSLIALGFIRQLYAAFGAYIVQVSMQPRPTPASNTSTSTTAMKTEDTDKFSDIDF